MHGSFSRADTLNFMAAIGPSFKTGFVDEAPVSNADIGKTIAHALELKLSLSKAPCRVAWRKKPFRAASTQRLKVGSNAARRAKMASRPFSLARASARRAISTPPVSRAVPSDWTSEKPQAADTYCRVEKSFSTRCLSAEVLFSPTRGRRRTDAPCPFPYSSETQTIILGDQACSCLSGG